MKKYLLAVLILLFIPQNILAGEMDEHINDFDFTTISSVINGGLDKDIERVDFKLLTKKIISGQFDFISLIDTAIDIFLRDVRENIYDIRNLFMLVIFAGIIKNLADSFNAKSTAEIAFYITYMVIITNLFASFKISVGIAQNLLQNLLQAIQAALPIIISLMTMSGNFIFHPIIFLISDILILIINFLLPAIVMFVTVQVINNMTGRNLIANLGELIKSLVSWSLKLISFTFMSILSLQRITAPLLETAAIKSAKFAVNTVPIVGEVFSSAVDSVISWAYVIKNGALVAIIIAVFFLCIAPIIKLAVFIFIYKIFGAVIQPISDERITKCIEAITVACSLLLSCCFSAVIIFLFAVIIFISM